MLLLSVVFILVAVYVTKDPLVRGLWMGLAVSVIAHHLVALFQSFYSINDLTADSTRNALRDVLTDRLSCPDELRKQGFARSLARRDDVPWRKLTGQARRRYWVCGTSLTPLSDDGILEELLQKGVKDIRIILPDTCNTASSCAQLKEYNVSVRGRKRLTPDQIQLAKDGLHGISGILERYGKQGCLQTYSGIMYHNITICDDKAIVSFYNTTGNGKQNWTLVFEGNDSEGYMYAAQEFLRMWPGKAGS
jgi:hypothetical protein